MDELKSLKSIKTHQFLRGYFGIWVEELIQESHGKEAIFLKKWCFLIRYPCVFFQEKTCRCARIYSYTYVEAKMIVNTYIHISEGW